MTQSVLYLGLHLGESDRDKGQCPDQHPALRGGELQGAVAPLLRPGRTQGQFKYGDQARTPRRLGEGIGWPQDKAAGPLWRGSAVTSLAWGCSCPLPFVFKMHKMVIYSKSESIGRRGSVPSSMPVASPTRPPTSSSQAPGMGNRSQGHMGAS